MNAASGWKFRKIVAVTALVGAVASAQLAATPAEAGPRYGYGRGSGYYGRGYGYRHYGGGGGGWVAGAAAAGLLGVLAGGAIAAQQPYYGGGYGGYGAYGYYPAARPCYLARQPLVDAWGNVVSYRRVQVCE